MSLTAFAWTALVVITVALMGPKDSRFYLSTDARVAVGVLWVVIGLVWALIAAVIYRRRPRQPGSN